MKKRVHMLDIYIAFCLLILISYTVINLIIFRQTLSEPSTLTTSVFAAFGGEFLTCGLIKIFKIRGRKEDNING